MLYLNMLIKMGVTTLVFWVISPFNLVKTDTFKNKSVGGKELKDEQYTVKEYWMILDKHLPQQSC